MYQLDDLDRGLLHALHVNGRAPFSHIAEALDVSTQTVARRYRRLRALASLRVIGLTDPQRTGESLWLARFSATPQAAQDIANSLARRSDTSWVKLASGGTEIVAVVRENNHSLLLHDTPRTTSITAVSAHYILHTYLGGPTAWSGHTTALSEDQQRLLRPPAVAGGSDQPLMAEDASLLAALGRDGRTSHADLATVTKRSPSTVARRLADLQASGAVFFDVEIDPACLGARAEALLWMSVMPARLDEVAGTLARHAELAFVAATTGRTNLVALALCPTPAALHDYLIHRLGTLVAINGMETAPVLRVIKSAGPLSPLAPAG
ncbi:AsnC family transcriptional regulator [Lentzea sp. NBC_00516]|uniref:Lrp/AsnC family transcriptional regulator n=1 Tax=Lentzea sp. NBC_00516 TaxID=2903582 RepID=UPI002E819D05|nr:AsnC family transcriptional regulator [Lentzea sp. NBC_00516]WUD28452.1 AsnC family transcriptional regulator [Lentzea sp. NBC_00516]